MTYQPPSTDPLPEEGDLRSLPFGELVFRAARDGKTGTLVVTDGKVNKAFHFLSGQIIGGRSNLPAESFAKLVVVRGKATRETVEGLGVPLLNDEAVEHALHQSGIDYDDLEDVMRYQLLVRLADTFARPALGYCWTEIESVGTPLSVNAYQLFTEGLARRVPREQLDVLTAGLAGEKPQITAGQTVFVLDADTLPTRASQLFRRVDGRMTFKELVDSVSRTATPDQLADTVYRAWVYLLAFLEAGFIELSAGVSSVHARQVTDAVRPSPRAAAQDEPIDLDMPSVPPAPGSAESESTVMVVAEAGGGAVAYREIEDPAITTRLETMQGQNFFEVLGVAMDANDNAVKKAYFKLAKEFHPDKLYNHKERTVKKFADKAFAIVNKAYEQLKSEAGRKEYAVKAKELSQGIDMEKEIKEAEALLRSEMDFQKAVVYLRKKDFPNALQLFRAVLEANPRESDHYAYTGWCEFQLTFPANEAGWKEAVSKMERGVEMNAKSYEAAFFLGQALKLTGNLDKAEALFQKVVKLRPHHSDAQRELRLIEQRRAQAAQSGPKDKNPFGKIFK